MDFEGALRARLTGAAAVTAIVGQRIYWVDRPQASTLPAITLQIIDEPREQHMGGFQNLQFVVVQIDIWARTYGEGKTLKEAVIAAVVPEVTANGIEFGTATNIRIRDLSERLETQFIHRPSIEARFNYSPA
jgi:hypothetical protein